MYRQMKKATNYVKVLVTGEYIERFLNMSRFKQLYFWDIERTDEGFMANISKVHFMQLKEISYKTKTKVRVIKRKGIGFVMFKYRKHYYFLVGVLIAFVLLYVCSLRVWNISFTGNVMYTDEFLEKKLRTLGVNFGMPLSLVDCDSIERELRNQFSQITWVSVQISGTKLIVHIKENDGAEEIEEVANEPRDIIATCDGVIADIITRKGTPQVKKGDTVKKGQILVSGVVPVLDDSGVLVNKIYTMSDADIMINTQTTYSDELEKTYMRKVYTGKTMTKKLLNVFGRDFEWGFSFSKYEEFDVVTQSKQFMIGEDFCLPIFYGNKRYLEYENQSAEYSKEEAEEILSKHFYKYTQSLLENKVQILGYNVKMDISDVCYSYDGVLQLKMPAIDYAPVTDDNEIKEESIDERS